MFLDEIRFQNKRLDFVINDDKFKIGDAFDEFARFRFHIARRLEILPYAISQVFRLSDIDDFPVGVFVNVNARLSRQIFEFFVQSH